MGKQSGLMARFQRELEIRGAEERHFGRTFQMDMVTLALGRMGFRAKKFDELDRMLTQVTTEYCRDILEDAKGDREIVYSKDVLDREIRQYVGEKRFVPYDERHKWR